MIDNLTRESLAIEVDQGITGDQVVRVMNRIVANCGAPRSIRVDNGPEFVSRALDQWAYLHQVTLDFSKGKTVWETVGKGAGVPDAVQAG